jgi:hypothetical protein
MNNEEKIEKLVAALRHYANGNTYDASGVAMSKTYLEEDGGIDDQLEDFGEHARNTLNECGYPMEREPMKVKFMFGISHSEIVSVKVECLENTYTLAYLWPGDYDDDESIRQNCIASTDLPAKILIHQEKFKDMVCENVKLVAGDRKSREVELSFLQKIRRFIQ